MFTTIERLKSTVSLALEVDDMTALEEIRADVSSILDKVTTGLQFAFDLTDSDIKMHDLEPAAGHIKTVLESKEQREKEAEVQDILEWLCPLDFEMRYSGAKHLLTEGTGVWFLKHPVFQQWVQSDRGILLGVGIPGAGKTLISTIVINELKRIFGTTNGVVLYAFCNFQDRIQHTTTGFLGGLLRQIATYSPNLRELSGRLQRECSQPSASDIHELIQDELKHTRRALIVVDALDEFGTNDGDKRALLKEICRLRKYANIFVTSRFETIENDLESIEGLSKIKIEAQEEDLEIWMAQEMPLLPPCVVNSIRLQQQISEKILSSVQGM